MAVLNIYNNETGQWEEVKTLKGSPASITLGEVTTLDETEQAYVTNTGTDVDAIYNFGIPRGKDGLTPVRGTNYWTAADQEQIISDVSTKIGLQFDELMASIQNKPKTYVFDDKDALDSSLDLTNNTVTYNGETVEVNTGDMFLLVSTDEPDYWYGEDSSGEKLHELDSRKIDLTPYQQKEKMQVMSYTDYSGLSTIDSSTFYFLYEE